MKPITENIIEESAIEILQSQGSKAVCAKNVHTTYFQNGNNCPEIPDGSISAIRNFRITSSYKENLYNRKASCAKNAQVQKVVCSKMELTVLLTKMNCQGLLDS